MVLGTVVCSWTLNYASEKVPLDYQEWSIAKAQVVGYRCREYCEHYGYAHHRDEDVRDCRAISVKLSLHSTL